MKALIYARVSPRGSDFDGETSISMQIDICRRRITDTGGEVVAVLSDEFFSGANTDRPGFREMMAQLSSGRAEWDTLCVYKLSRLSRSQRDTINTLSELSRFGKGFLSVTENYDYSTPIGRAMMGFMQVVNQLEREQTSENTRNKMISIASRGYWPVGRPPFGYRRGEKGDNNLYIEPRKAAMVKDIFRMYSDGQHTTRDIQKKYPELVKQTMFNILRNRAYLGKIVYAGQEYPGRHPALITEALFELANSMLPQGEKKYAKQPKNIHICWPGCYDVTADATCHRRLRKAENITITNVLTT